MKPQDIPGLAQYLPATPKKSRKGFCKDCSKAIPFDYELETKGIWQASYCEPCLDKVEE